MQTVKLCFQQVICDVPYRDEFIVRWRVQLRENRSAVSTFVEEDSPSSTGQRKFRLSEGWPILVTFHFFLVPVRATNIFSELIHPLLKLPNCVLKQQLQILQLSSYYLKRSARLSPSSRSRNRLCRRTATSIHSCLIFQKTLHCTRKQRSRLTCPTYSGM